METREHLTPEEALAIGRLSMSNEWDLYKAYLKRKYAIAQRRCEVEDKDHRYNQGRAFELSEMAKIETKAVNIINGNK